MSLSALYDDSNIFARILRGEASAHRVFEDDAVLAIMDIFPMSRGHVLVLPKARARTLLDLTEDEAAALMRRVRRIARAAADALKPDGLTLLNYNAEAGGQSVFHVHVHVIPRWTGVKLDHARAERGKAEDSATLAAEAEAIAAALHRMSPER